MWNSAFYNRVKFSEDHVRPRKTAWLMTGMAALTMILMLSHQTRLYMVEMPTIENLRVLQSGDSRMQLHINVTFPHASCDELDIYHVAHQSVFMLPTPEKVNEIQLIERETIPKEKIEDPKKKKKKPKPVVQCHVEGLLKVPRANGLFWIQSKLKNSESVKADTPTNFTHTVDKFNFYNEDEDIEDIHSNIRSGVFAFLDFMPGFQKEHSDLQRGINGWTYTFPELSIEMLEKGAQTKEQVDANEPEEIDKLIDQYLYEIAISPRLSLDEDEDVNDDNVYTSYTQTFLPHHARYYLSDSRGWVQNPMEGDDDMVEEFERMAEPSKTSVVFMYQMFDVTTLEEPDIKELNTFLGRMLATIGGIYTLFTIADRMVTVIPALFGAKID